MMKSEHEREGEREIEVQGATKDYLKLLEIGHRSVGSSGHQVHSKPVLWEPQIRETRNYGINLIGPNFFPFVSLLFFPAFKGSAYKGIPPIWDKIFGPLNYILSPIWDFFQLTMFL